MSLGIARVAMKDENQVKKFMESILGLGYFTGEDWKVTSPDVIREVWLKLIEVSGEVDPLREIKDEQNRRALAIYSAAKELVSKSKDPFLAAVKLAIAGNSIDAMTDVKGGAPEEIIERWDRLEIDSENLDCLKERLKKARRLVYLGDN